MMRPATFALALLAAASSAAAQLPPSISKPIEAAKKAAAASNAQTRATEQAGAERKSTPQPAEASAAMAQQGRGAPGARIQVAKADTAARRGSATESGGKGQVTFYREVYSYSDDGRRDPFLSLMATGELRPVLTDLSLIGVIYSASGGSLATLIDASTGETYRVRVGNVLGRMKVVKIGPQDITFSIDEFGFSRQETLLIDHTSKKAGAAPGRRAP